MCQCVKITQLSICNTIQETGKIHSWYGITINFHIEQLIIPIQDNARHMRSVHLIYIKVLSIHFSLKGDYTD